ncbi:WD40 repeat domain-containing protein [Streptomyces sp. C10]|uniref:WD40 repeat domain-containing protein n=1 Tax=Streptomyces sp. C10 TaxID=531941 RepID=UPI00398092E5
MNGHHPSAGSDEVHRRIADALSALVTSDPTVPPHPYLSRHLAQHASYGKVLDDSHVPPALLPWETSASVRRLLHQQDLPRTGQSWLKAWAALEPFLNGADAISRVTSLHLAHHAEAFRRTPPQQLPATARFAGSRVTPLWSDCAPPDNVWALTNTRIEALTHATNSRGCRAVLISGDDHGTIRIWRADGSPATTPLHTGGAAIQHLLPLHDGLIAAGSTDGTVRILDSARGRLLSEALTRPHTWVSSLTLYKPAGHPPVLLAAHSDGHLTAFSTATYAPVDIPLPPLPRAPTLLAAIPQPDNDGTLLVLAQRHTVSHWDGRTLTPASRHDGDIRAITPLPAPGHYATCDDSGDLSFFDTAAPAEPTATARRLHTGPLTALVTVTVDTLPALASAGADGTVRLWHARTAQPLGDALQGHTTPITAMATYTTAQQDRVITTGADNTVRSWPLRGHTSRPPRPPWHCIRAAAMPAPHTCVHQPLLAVADEDGTHVWNIETGRHHALRAGPHATALTWARTDSTLLLATAHNDASVTLHPVGQDTAAPEPAYTLTGHALPVTTMTTLGYQSQSLLATGSADGTVRLWNLHTRDQLAVFPDHHLSVRAVTTLETADGPLIASAGTDGTVRLWHPGTRQQHGTTLRCGQHTVTALATAPAGPHTAGLLVTAGQDGTVRLWHPGAPHTAAQPHCFAPHDGPLTAVTCLRSPAQHPLVAAAGRSGIHVWDAATGTLLLRIVTGRPITHLSVHRPPIGRSSGAAPVLLAAGQAGVRVFRLRLDQT